MTLTSDPTTDPTSDSSLTTTDVQSRAFSVHVTATTPIATSAEKVWAVLAGTDRYPEWNPFVRRLDGELRVGERIEVDLQLPGRKLQTMTPEIVEVSDGRAFQWLGGFGPTGIFDGRHRFEVRPVTAQSCELVHSERLSGILVPFFRSMLTGPTPAAFVAFNDALAELATS